MDSMVSNVRWVNVLDKLAYKTTSVNKNNYYIRLQETEYARIYVRICSVIIYAAQAIRQEEGA